MNTTPPSAAAAAVTGMSRAAFWLMLRRIAVFAGCVDLIYLVVFFVLGMPVMAIVNVVSLGMYAAAWHLLGQRRNLPAVLLMWTEVLVHAGLCTVLLGWASGVHYFLLVFISAVAVSRAARHATTALAFLLLVYLGLDAATQLIPIRYPLPNEVTTALRWLNITVVFVMFGYTGRYYVQRVAEAEARLREMATTDAMSGLWNRRHFLTLAQGQIERARRDGSAVALVLADIDHFKQVNDRHGHDAGDRVIQHVSGLLHGQLRAGDLLGRWGGEEFILLLPGCDAPGAAQLCERMRAHIARSPCEAGAGMIPVTVSFGVMPMPVDVPFEQAVQQADAALYRAKGAGRNRVVAAAA
ncbi:GGDEF domain-containing protein [Aquincola sp. S2]|uniref:diguanylate cyclase n=1 Tax=Pseudaquabacterium terrae TaxID=2732868 RepID=A0ABX2EF12_9BURK|nr:GGDEF domain-containing protein [Aquabacterium terrae]NRF67194.1 GGDEF domain-containing protein [Aquabacterium terrae]